MRHLWPAARLRRAFCSRDPDDTDEDRQSFPEMDDIADSALGAMDVLTSIKGSTPTPHVEP